MLVFCLLCTSPGFADTVFFDDFNNEITGTYSLNYTGFDNWSVSGGTADIIGNSYFYALNSYGLYVDKDGSNSDAGIMTSIDLNLSTGEYQLSFPALNP